MHQFLKFLWWNFRHYITEISDITSQKFQWWNFKNFIKKFLKLWNFITKFLKDEISEIFVMKFHHEISVMMIEISEILIEISEISVMKFHLSEISWWNFWFFSTEISEISSQKLKPYFYTKYTSRLNALCRIANRLRLGCRGEESVTLVQRKREKRGKIWKKMKKKWKKMKKMKKKTHEYLNIIRVRFPTYENEWYGRRTRILRTMLFTIYFWRISDRFKFPLGQSLHSGCVPKDTLAVYTYLCFLLSIFCIVKKDTVKPTGSFCRNYYFFRVQGFQWWISR